MPRQFRVVSFLLILIGISFSLAAQEDTEKQELLLSETPLIQNFEARVGKTQSRSDLVNSWTPYWMLLCQPKSSPFFLTNIGVGFLYFNQVRGNFTTVPGNIANFSGGDEPLEGKLQYNRTPLFEYLLGYQLNHWFKLALSYQFQSGVAIQTAPRANSAFNANVTGRVIVTIFKANLNLNSLMTKFYFEYPVPMIWKNIGYTPYAAIGVGPGWQSWTDLQITRIQTASFATTATIVEQSLKQKICANVAWMFDLGFRLRSTNEKNTFFMLAGVKYNQWGQARNLGKLSQQGGSKIGFLQPFSIKTVYSFAPYLGAQWNFPNMTVSKSPFTLNGRSLNTWKPFFTQASCLGDIKTVWTECNVGVGLLYFNQVTGSLSSRPRDAINNLASNVPYKEGGIIYNRTPLLEFLLGFRLRSWLRIALSYQHQSDISVSTKIQNYQDLNTGIGLANSKTYAQLKSNLILDSGMGKAYLELPSPLVFRSIATSPYLALGIGAGWQTWTQLNVWRYTNSPAVTTTSAAQPLASAICANAVWMADLGMRLQSVYPQTRFSVLMGCKYTQWGQARNLGKRSHQDYRCYGLVPPFKIKTIYSFAPYLGVYWNYPIYNEQSSKFLVKGRNAHTWKPYLASINELQGKQAVWVEYSLGLGFLYFHQIKGHLGQTPSVQSAGYTDIAPIGSELSYNRTPVYEFMMGYRYSSWFKLCVSYQTQRNITISTKYMRPGLASEINNAVQFTSNLELDSLMAKVYFELPYALILRSLAASLYASVGIGPSWQSWTQMEYRLVSSGARRAQYYNEKICANVSFMGDVGFRVQSVSSNGAFSVTKGIKYMQWGQTRNLGELSQQGSLKTGLFKPVGIKVLYSFIPYFGVQWNF